MGIYVYLSGAWEKVTSDEYYKYKGNVSTINDLPDNADIGDTYYVESEYTNYSWDGTQWKPTGSGSSIVPLSNSDIDSIIGEV